MNELGELIRAPRAASPAARVSAVPEAAHSNLGPESIPSRHPVGREDPHARVGTIEVRTVRELSGRRWGQCIGIHL